MERSVNENTTPYDKIKEDEMYRLKTGEYLSTVYFKMKELSEEDLEEAKYCATRFCETVSNYNLRKSDCKEERPVDEKMFTMIYDGIKNGDKNVISNALVFLNTIKTKCEKEYYSHDFSYGEKFFCFRKNYENIVGDAEHTIGSILHFRDKYELEKNYEARNKYPNLSFLLKSFDTEMHEKWDMDNPETKEILDICELRLSIFRKYLECYVRLSEADMFFLNMLMEMDEYKEIDFSELFDKTERMVTFKDYRCNEYDDDEYEDKEDYERCKSSELRSIFSSNDFLETEIPNFARSYNLLYETYRQMRRDHMLGTISLGGKDNIVNLKNCLIYHGCMYYGFMENQPLYENPLKDEATKKTIEWVLGETNDEQFIENIDKLIKLNCEKSEMQTIGKDKATVKEKGIEK